MPGAVTPKTPPNGHVSARPKPQHNHVSASIPVLHTHQLGIAGESHKSENDNETFGWPELHPSLPITHPVSHFLTE